MDPDTYRRASEVFSEAVSFPRSERAEFVEARCAGDDELRAAVELLLANDPEDATHDPFAQPLVRVESISAEEGAGETFPRPFGRYTLLRRLGRGGMGVVYEAEQDRPRQRVALKVLARHAVSEKALERFQREAEVLGRLRHPGIAAIHDAGEVESVEGRQPFLAMELIDGRTLVEDAVARGLSARERMNLVADVCDAVHYAHQNGVIHRDLKPDNVMVTERGAVKVLDFGIARVTDGLDEGAAQRTEEGTTIGTLNYMSPEQFSGSWKHSGERSDVYSLGAMLFEVLAECPPHDLRNRSVFSAIQHLEQNEPPALSDRVPALAGDPTTIVAKAVARDPNARYPSAAALGADILRYLRDEPIQARPQSVFYRLRMFTRRNRQMVAAVTIAFLALAIGTATATWQAISARKAQRASEISEKGSRAVSEFLIKEILTAGTPDVAQGEEVSLSEAFERGAARLHLLDEEPEVQAGLYHTLGDAFLNLGRNERARESYQKALDWRRANLGEDDRETVTSLLGLCSALKRIRPYEDALPQQLLAYELSLARSGPKDEQTRHARHNLGTLYNRLERREEAVRELRPILDGFSEDENVLLRFEVMHSLGTNLASLGEFDEARALIDSAIQGKVELLGELHPSTLVSQVALGVCFYRAEDYPAAVDQFGETMELVERVHGENHEVTRSVREFFGNAVVLLGEGLDRAERPLMLAIEQRLEDPEDNPSQLAHNYSLLGAVRLDQGRLADARSCFETAIERFEKIDAEHPGIPWTQRWLSELDE